MKQHIAELIRTALNELNTKQQWNITEIPTIQVDLTKDKQHGDFACNIALILAKSLQRKPRDIAENIIAALPSSSRITKIEIAGPGFINFFVSSTALHAMISDILSAAEQYGKKEIGKGKKVLVEFVSSNPTGPLHVGHGRHAAYGAVVANLLETVGYHVHREYYINDAGRQMDILAVSTWMRYLSLCGEKISFPANGYQGEYIIDTAKALQTQFKNKFQFSSEKTLSNLPLDEPQGGDKEIYIDALIARAKELLGEQNYRIIFNAALKNILEDIRQDLSEFGVNYDEWFSEYEFTRTDAVNDVIAKLKEKNLVYEREGALWFRSTDFDDEKDRVLKRSNGQVTYFANDLAYHINKIERGFDFAIDIWGSDHHGYIPRMRAGLKAYGIASEKLIYLLVQFVTLYRDGVQAQMSTRSGSFVTLRELREEIGNDAARFFYVTRKFEQHMDFDLNLAKSKTNENPVYYVQYAHARICSVFRQCEEKKLSFQQTKELDPLKEPQELALISTLSHYVEVLSNAAAQYEPYLLVNYLRQLANDFHTYYNSCQFLVENDAIRNARLTLVLATRQVLQNGLKLLGVSAPENM